MRIVIFGLAKTGTSALFHRIADALPPDALCLFEPEARPPLHRLRDTLALATHRGDVLAKVLPFRPAPPVLRRYDAFDRPLLLIRDPRDRLVSSILYQAYEAGARWSDAAADAFVALIGRKEADPASVSLVDILASYAPHEFDLAHWCRAHAARCVARPLAFHAERPRLHVVRYEDMIANRLAPLEDHLALPLAGAAEVAANIKRVERSKGAGAWRDWWTPRDVRLLGPMLQPLLDRYYPAADWQLHDAPHLVPEHGSAYVRRIVDERRAVS